MQVISKLLEDNQSSSNAYFSIFTKKQILLGIICFLIAFVTYWITLTPNIGMNDDGEMVTAALHFGVMHPSGYPLWTLLAGLFSKIPIGIGVVKINLFSGLCTALAVGLFSVLMMNINCWLGMSIYSSMILAFLSALTFAWATPVWSHGVVGKGTYALHVCLMILFLILCYVWIRCPDWKDAFVWIVFLFFLGMSNHHMTLAMAALPLVVILLLYPKYFLEYSTYSLFIASLLYIGFAYLSEMPDVWQASIRLFYTACLSILIIGIFQKKLIYWKDGIALMLAVFLGLLPYIYMPVASSTNPPMNWSYTRTSGGFFYAINRSQYWGTLADQLQSTVGYLMGVPPTKKALDQTQKNHETIWQSLFGFMSIFWKSLFHNISYIPLLSALCSLFLFWKLSYNKKVWLCVLIIGFLLSAFLQPISWNNGYDNYGWEMQAQWQGLCYGFFILIAFYGASILWVIVEQSRFVLFWHYCIIILSIVTVICTFIAGLPQSSQRGHWFGWMYGHDMLVDLPRDSLVFGGTDPGRFIPTYMIFGESFEKSNNKLDPLFDRRDLYIITQNALADIYYNHYLADQYTDARPNQYSWFEKILGRETTYPKETLILPTSNDISATLQLLYKQYQNDPHQFPNPQTDPCALNSILAEMIFLNNRDKHHFFVEESFPMLWSYPYAVPHGLCYEINHDKLDKLPVCAAENDIAWWNNYIKKLESIPGFRNNSLAQHSFGKLRITGGNIYFFRKMYPEAELAYRQSLLLWPANVESTSNLMKLLYLQGRYTEAYNLIHQSLLLDPHNKTLQSLQQQSEKDLQIYKELEILRDNLKKNPQNHQLFFAFMDHLFKLEQKSEMNRLISNQIVAEPSSNWLREIINFYVQHADIEKALNTALKLKNIEPHQWDVPFTIAKYQLILGKQDESVASLKSAVLIGKKIALDKIMSEPLFQKITNLNNILLNK